MVNKPLIRPYFWGGYVRKGLVDQSWLFGHHPNTPPTHKSQRPATQQFSIRCISWWTIAYFHHDHAYQGFVCVIHSSNDSHSAILDPEKKPFERLIFPTKYVIPKSLSRLAIGQVRISIKYLAYITHTGFNRHHQCSFGISTSIPSFATSQHPGWGGPDPINTKLATLPETNIAAENRPSQWESSLPTTIFQGLR